MQGNSTSHTLERLFTPKPVNAAARVRFEAQIGWRYGIVFGLMLIAVAFGVDAIDLLGNSVALFWIKLLLALITVVPLAAASGALGGRTAVAFRYKLLAWMAAGAVIGWLVIHFPFEGMSGMAALIDPAVRGVTISPFTAGAKEREIPLILFGALGGLFAAILQVVATIWAWERSSSENRITKSGWVALLISAPLAITLGAAFDGAANAQLRAPPKVTHRAIQVALNTPPDVDRNTLEMNRLFDYVATSRWRAQFSRGFKQHLVDFDPQTLRWGYVDAEFDNGFIWRCQVVRNGENLAGCLDVGATYRDWMVQFLATGVIQCQNCVVQIAPAARAWQVQQPPGMEPTQISAVHHSGGLVVVKITFGNARPVECRLVGAEPAVVHDCAVAN